MTPAPLADVAALEKWLGEAITEDADVQRAELVLRFASALVRRESGRTWLDDNGELIDVPDDVHLVTLAVAGRAYVDVEGWVRESVDDWTGEKESAEAGVYLTAAEESILAAFKGNRYGGLGVVETTRGDAPMHRLGLFGQERLLPPWY